ncbi:hypothetical protein CHU98_g11354 [Xylaria longipes]|nr:hypothetical protein CHU98_g11354 [Xylaria longipes]
MLQGDLSNLRRGGGASPSRAGSFRGSWRGSRGGWHQGKNQVSKGVDDKTPLGRPITEFTLDDITMSAISIGEARITNYAYAASYSLNDEKPFKIIVPGQPATWTPPSLPCQLVGDNGDYLRDQNGSRFPNHPIQPAVQALFTVNKTFDPSSIDVMGCASSLGDILRFARSIDSTFRFDAEMIGNTLFLIRNCKSDVIPDVRGYGHSFMSAFTSGNPDSGKTKSHQRVVSYNFGSLRCLVRFECDGYLASYDGNETIVTEPQFNLSPLPSSSIATEKSGVKVPQDLIFDIKTKSRTWGEIQKSENIPRLWLRQIPNFITAYHNRGTFQDVQVSNVRKDLVDWETQHQDELKRFAAVLRQLITEMKRASHLKLEIYREGTGPLQLRERGEATGQALPNSWRDRWAAMPQPSSESSTNRDDIDEDSDTYPLTRASSEGSDSSAADFAFDYTACTTDCGYCGQDALHRALTSNNSPIFINKVVSDLLNYLQDPELERLCDGELLAQILWIVVDPPIFWNNLLRGARNRMLDTKALEGLTWLLLRLTMLPSPQSNDFRATAKSILQEGSLLTSCSPKTERLLRQIKSIVAPFSTPGTGLLPTDGPLPGGRHDNDFTNYRDIAILPTRDELLSTERPFYLHASSIAEADASNRTLMHFDNQFRLLREDMIGDMQEEFRNVTSRQQTRGFRNIFIPKLSFEGCDRVAMMKRPCTLLLQCEEDILSENLEIQGNNTLENRKKAVKRVYAFLKHQSFGCLVSGNNILGFTSIDRNEDQLARNPPRICLRITESDSLEQILRALQRGPVDYLQLSTPVFAYEPILERLQRRTDIELSIDILGLSEPPQLSPFLPRSILDSLQQQQSGTFDLQTLLGLSKSVSLDPSQIEAVIHGLTYQVGLIQGPPGTGKSLVGALLTKVLLDNTDQVLLVISYTNHALDQLLEDLLDIGINSHMIVRLGSKSTPRTAPLLLIAQDPTVSRRHWARYRLIEHKKDRMRECFDMIDRLSANFFPDQIPHRQDKLLELTTQIKEFNYVQKTLKRLLKDKTERILQSKMIIACTTTAASIYAAEIQSTGPGIIIVEEAGEILESHILAAMGPAKHLIQIGDYKQLRPKVKNYKLSVEAGNGYDFNRSLFKRLIFQGRPSCTLSNQHRMRPEISELIRHNYPALRDAESTHNRPHLLGFQDDIIFVNHSYPETKHNVLQDKLDPTVKWSQQNYKTDNPVILTPYLAQLSLLREKLSQDHDPILSDVDSHDLVEAGILLAASADVNKKPIRLSTIDNYQGEESDIVVVSLTRSNDNGEIGFMAAPERLNVLISRARNALIMIGNANTFINAKKGRDAWLKLLNDLELRAKVHDGFPVKCEKHPDRVMTIRSPDEFYLHCPDGGCTEPCPELLSCGKHTCPKRCHLRVDHSKISCGEVLKDRCINDHQLVWQCSNHRPPPCQTCRFEKEEKERKARRDKDLEFERQAKQRAYAKQLTAVKDDILHPPPTSNWPRSSDKRGTEASNEITPPPQRTIENKPHSNKRVTNKQEPTETDEEQHHDILGPKPTDQPQAVSQETEDSDVPEVSQIDEAELAPIREPSSTERDWQQQKEFELASSEAIDSLMQMVGLETVKKEFLTIKAKVDTTIRQEADLKGHRFGAALFGNPGTVARLYGKFLSSMGVIPGSHFEGTTGSRLAHGGIQVAQALLDKLLQKGGGVLFLDEAYQILSNSSSGGSQILDFLLAEIENYVKKSGDTYNCEAYDKRKRIATSFVMFGRRIGGAVGYIVNLGTEKILQDWIYLVFWVDPANEYRQKFNSLLT